MAQSIAQFWSLLRESGLISRERQQRLEEDAAQRPPAAGDAARDLCAWLVSRKVLTTYQAKVLLAGRSGPFWYGDYVVRERLKGGPLDGCFLALDAPSGHPVILSFVPRALAADPHRWAAMVGRAGKLQALDHPQVRGSYQTLDSGDYKFFVWEQLRGQSLAETLAGSGQLPLDDALAMAAHISRGVQALHRGGLVHGDLSPAAVWQEPTGHSRVLVDPARLPVARFPVVTAAGVGASTPDWADYLAPELGRPGQLPTEGGDVYALGCVLYQTLSGQVPFPGGDLQGKLQRHARDPIRPLTEFGLPAPVGELVAFMMAKNPSVRWSLGEVRKRLQPLLKRALPRDGGPPPETWQAYRRSLAGRARLPNLPAQVNASPPGVPLPAAGSTTPTGEAVTAGPVVRPVGQREPEDARVAVAQPAVAVQPVAPAQPVVVAQSAAGDPTAAQPIQPFVSDGVTGESNSVVNRYQRRRRQPLGVWIGVGCAAVGLMLAGVWMLGPGRGSAPPPPGDSQVTAAGGRPTAGSGQVSSNSTMGKAERQQPGEASSAVPGPPPLAAADSGFLWASPTSGQPLTLELVPPGTQLILACRPAALLAHPEGARLLQALGPVAANHQAQLEQACGWKLDQLQRLLVAWYEHDEAFPLPAFVVDLPAPLPRAELLARWGQTEPQRTEHGEYFLAANGWAYYLPAGESAQRFLMASEREVQGTLEFAGSAPPSRAIGTLLKESDADRHLTVLFQPTVFYHSLFRDGRSLYFGPPAKLRKPLQWLLSDELEAGMFSLHLDADCYVELRALAALDKDRFQLANDLRERMRQIPDSLESYLVRINPHPHWKKLAIRYPSMVRFLAAQARAGVDKDQALVNSVLPPQAAHNLLLGGELLLATAPGAPVQVAASGGGRPNAPANYEELLQHRMSLMIPQQDLELAIQDLTAQLRDEFPQLPFDLQIKIAGPDLQLAGITRNQAIRNFDAQNQTLAEVLTGIVRKANPDPAATAPSDPKQLLIWLITKDDSGKPILLLTTRAAVARDKLVLPEVFQVKSDQPNS